MTAHQLLERIANGRTDLIWDFVAHRHVASAEVGDRDRLLEWSAYYGDVSAIRFLVEQGGSLEALGDDLGLRGAAFHGHWQLCEFLIESGADINAAARDTGETPLHTALCTSESWASWYVRPDAILRRLCYGQFTIHPDRKPMQVSLLGQPYEQT